MKKVIFRLLVIGMLLAIGPMTASAEAGSPVIQSPGVVDVSRVAAESPKIKALQEQLNEKGRELSSQLEEAKANLSAAEFQVKQQAAYDEFMRIKQGMESQFNELLQQSLAEVAKEKQLTIILFKSSVAYGGMDITADVINKLQ